MDRTRPATDLRADVSAQGDAGRPPPRTARHAGDIARMGLGLAVLGLGLLAARQGRLSLFERDVFRLVNDLPKILFPVVWAVMQLGNVVTVPVVAILAGLWRRLRMAGDLMFAVARDLAIAGAAAYVLARLVKDTVGRGRPADFPVGAILHEPPMHGLGFVSGHAAVAAALATAAAPYLTRRGRRIVWLLAWAVAFARVYMGAHLPLDVVGGLALGWIIGSALHLLVGVPRWTPSAAHVSALLTRFGLPHRDLRPADLPARSSHPFFATGVGDRELFVKVLDPDPPDEDWIFRLAQLVAVRDVKDTDALARLDHQAEHEAAVTLAARHQGVRVPAVLLARGAEGRALVVQERVAGSSLDTLPVASVDADLLAAVWRQVRLLRAARIAHRDLVDSSVVVDPAGAPWLVDFGNAEVGADDHALATDVAELLASLSVRLPPATVVAAAVRALGPAPVRAALPLLQPLVLTAVTRSRLRAEPGRLEAVRREVRERLGMPAVDSVELAPAGPAARLLAAAGAATVLVLLPVAAGGSAVLDSLQSGWWRWLGVAAAVTAVGRLARAAGLSATVGRRLAVGRSVVAQAVATGSSLLYGRRGGPVAALGHLRRTGLSDAEAIALIGRLGLAVRIAAITVSAAAVATAAALGSVGSWDSPSMPVAVLAAGAAGGALVLSGQLVARAAVRPVAPAGPAVAGLSAARLSILVGCAALAATADGLAFAAVLEGVGADVPVLIAAAFAVLAPVLWSALPPAGGAGAVELLMILGLAALGVPIAPAVAGVVLSRFVTYWLPAGLGSLVAARLVRRLVL